MATGDGTRASVVWTIGDLAELKSGGPTMTVVATAGEAVTCGWFTEGEYLATQFPRAALDRASGKNADGAR
jgi:uncharacterized protein YodC (DUF2158 family)